MDEGTRAVPPLELKHETVTPGSGRSMGRPCRRIDLCGELEIHWASTVMRQNQTRRGEEEVVVDAEAK
jgi:hypothetical protein